MRAFCVALENLLKEGAALKVGGSLKVWGEHRLMSGWIYMRTTSVSEVPKPQASALTTRIGCCHGQRGDSFLLGDSHGHKPSHDREPPNPVWAP